MFVISISTERSVSMCICVKEGRTDRREKGMSGGYLKKFKTKREFLLLLNAITQLFSRTHTYRAHISSSVI
jgi:hypothetical protein